MWLERVARFVRQLEPLLRARSSVMMGKARMNAPCGQELSVFVEMLLVAVEKAWEVPPSWCLPWDSGVTRAVNPLNLLTGWAEVTHGV